MPEPGVPAQDEERPPTLSAGRCRSWCEAVTLPTSTVLSLATALGQQRSRELRRSRGPTRLTLPWGQLPKARAGKPAHRGHSPERRPPMTQLAAVLLSDRNELATCHLVPRSLTAPQDVRRFLPGARIRFREHDRRPAASSRDGGPTRPTAPHRAGFSTNPPTQQHGTNARNTACVSARLVLCERGLWPDRHSALAVVATRCPAGHRPSRRSRARAPSKRGSPPRPRRTRACARPRGRRRPSARCRTGTCPR